MKTLRVKAVIMTDGENYFIHGASDETPDKMFKAMHPIWDFDPSKEMVHYVEVNIELPELEKSEMSIYDFENGDYVSSIK